MPSLATASISSRFGFSPVALDDVADQENQNADSGEFVFVGHPGRLRDPDVERKANVGESERLQNFGEDEHQLAATSDVNPRRNQDVLDIERVTQRPLDKHAGHRKQQAAVDSKSYRTPLLD